MTASSPWKAREARPFHPAQDSQLRCSVTPAGEQNFSTIVVPDRVLRVRVLDARSRTAVPNAVIRRAWLLPKGVPDPTKDDEASYDARYSALHLPLPIDWDIKANPPILTAANGEPPKGFAKPDWSGLKRALVALEYSPGAGPKDDVLLQEALTRFRTEHDIQEPGPRAKDPKTVPRIIAEHNTHAYRMIQRYLTTFGFACASDDGNWEIKSKEAFTEWQKLHCARRKHLHARPDASDVAVLLAENTHFKTDSAGVARFPVPIPFMRSGFRLVLEFNDFAYIPAFDIPQWRSPGTPLVEWVSTQDVEAGTWGWRLRPPRDARPVEELPEFRTSYTFTLPPLTGLSWVEMGDDDAAFAAFNEDFRKAGAPAEIDVIALVWCQPAWDSVDDPSRRRTNTNVYLPQNPPVVRHKHLHVVTRYQGYGTEGYPHAAEGYGLLDVDPVVLSPTVTRAHYRGREKGHKGIDVQVTMKSPVFAFHGGLARPHSEGVDVGAGHFVRLKDPKDTRITLDYFHLEESGRADGKVRAGQIVGRLGRTGNINKNPYTPSHVHIERFGDKGMIFGLADVPDEASREANLVCFPTNSTIPRLFPCRCEMEGPSDVDINNCGFKNMKFTDECWAVGKLVCPHMRDPDVDIFRQQAQFRWLRSKTKDNSYADPGPVNGASSIQLKKAIKAFRAAHGFTIGEELDAEAVAMLDKLALTEEPES